MDSNHETGNSTRSVAGATRMPSDATDDDEVRERGAFLGSLLAFFHCAGTCQRQRRTLYSCTTLT